MFRLSRYAINSRATYCRYLSYYNNDNKNNEETSANNANVLNTPVAPYNSQLARIENKIDWIIILTYPTWIWTIGMSIYKLLH